MTLKNQIKNFGINSYIWFITKLKLKIAMQAVYTRIFNLYKQHLSEFAGHCHDHSQNVGNFIRLLNHSDQNVEFVVGDHKLGIIAEAKISQEMAFLKTYRLLGKYEEYAEIKAVHIPELDIVLSKYGHTRFAMSKPVEGSFGVTTDMAQITDFSVQYLNAVMDYLKDLEGDQIRAINVQPLV
jgi:hypothetical protein